MDEERVFELDGVEYRYPRGAEALQDVTLNIRKGERIGLLGANGCGKSTLLKLLDGLLFPTTGEARAYGVVLNPGNLRDSRFSAAFRSRVGFIFQRSEVQLFCPTVWDEIAFGPLQLGLPAEEVQQRVADVIAMLDLAPLRDRAPYQLSGGEQKKVAVASVLSVNPEVLLLDEPMAALDPLTQRWLLSVLQALQRAGKTLVLATHDLDLLPTLVERVVVIGQDHRVARDGPLAEVMADHELLHRANLAHHHLPSPDAPPLEPAQIHGAHSHE